MSDLLTGDIPESAAAAKKNTGVTHLNNRPLIAIVVFIAALLGIAAFALKSMGDRQNKTVEQTEEDYSAVKQSNFVDSYLNDRSDGVISRDVPPAPPAFMNELPDPETPIKTVSLQKAVEKVPEPTLPEVVVPPCGTEAECQKIQQLQEALANERMRMEMLKRTQLENAANDSMRVNFNRSGDPEIGLCEGDDCGKNDGTKDSNKSEPQTPEQIRARSTDKLNMMVGLLETRLDAALNGDTLAVPVPVPVAGSGGMPFNVPPGSFRGDGNSLSPSGIVGSDPLSRPSRAVGGGEGVTIGNYGQPQTDYLEQTLMDPRSEIEIKAGTVIRATLLTGINSDLPGQVIGQVTRNVWDSIDGEYILIPQGTRLIGRYESGISFGQKRVLVAWDRLIYPNGQSIRLEGMGGYDTAGQSGYADKVNNHYIKAFSSAILFSVVSAGVSKVDSQTAVNTGVFSTESEFKKELGKQISQLSGRYIDRALNISPTLSIRQGYVMNIMVDKDIVLPPYRNMHDQFKSRYVSEEQ